MALPGLWAPPEAPQSSQSLSLTLEPVQTAPPFPQQKTLPLPAFFEMSRRESPKEKAKNLKVT